MTTIAQIEISVIIPVYNAGKYIEDAIISALSQPQTKEVILVEDGSPDNSLEVCRALAAKYKNVRLYQHPNGVNKGAAASRNLGIRKAKYKYVAFLDADDYYLPNRFKETEKIFLQEPEADGVYEAIGSYFEDKQSKQLFESVGLRKLTTVKNKIPPNRLFESFMRGGAGGYYSIIGFTAKRKVFSNVAFFDENLEMYEDTMLMFQLSAKCKLYPGIITSAVAIRRVHSSNRITHRFADKEKTYHSVLNLWLKFLNWAIVNLHNEQVDWVIGKIMGHIKSFPIPNKYSKWKIFIESRKMMLQVVKRSPRLIFKPFFWKYLIPRPWKEIW